MMRRLVRFLVWAAVLVPAAAGAAGAGDGDVPVASSTVEESILDALAARGVDVGSVVLDLSAPAHGLVVPADGLLTAERMAYHPQTRRFSAILAVHEGGAVVQRTTVAGRVHRMVEMPVLARRLGRGETISAEDIRWLELRDHRIPANAVLDAGELIGLASRRPLRPGVPVLASDVRKPVLVERGSLVTMVLTSGGLSLTARGRALEDGGSGEAIRVANPQSGQIVIGTVTGPGVVAMGATPPRPQDHAL